jgi:hypothetical protein
MKAQSRRHRQQRETGEHNEVAMRDVDEKHHSGAE